LTLLCLGYIIISSSEEQRSKKMFISGTWGVWTEILAIDVEEEK
jgi:hypothetical protein